LRLPVHLNYHSSHSTQCNLDLASSPSISTKQEWKVNKTIQKLYLGEMENYITFNFIHLTNIWIWCILMCCQRGKPVQGRVRCTQWKSIAHLFISQNSWMKETFSNTQRCVQHCCSKRPTERLQLLEYIKCPECPEDKCPGPSNAAGPSNAQSPFILQVYLSSNHHNGDLLAWLLKHI
jgi:hypothetical protein